MKVDSSGFLTVKEIYGVPFKINAVPTTSEEYKATKVTSKKYIVIHNDGNLNADEKANAEFMKKDDNVLWHFTVGKDSIVQGHSVFRSGFHAGDGKDGAGNLYGIGVEVDEGQAAAENSFKLIKFLQDESPFGPLTLKPHQFFSPNKKHCPKWILDNWGWEGFLERYSLFRKDHAAEVNPHWSEQHFQSLNKKGIVIHERRFDDKITRGEVMALLDKIYRG